MDEVKTRIIMRSIFIFAFAVFGLWLLEPTLGFRGLCGLFVLSMVHNLEHHNKQKAKDELRVEHEKIVEKYGLRKDKA